MSLNWDVSNIEDFKQLCFIPDTIDEKGIVHPDRVRLNPITDVLIWGSMSIGVSRITKKNYRDVHRRYKMLEQAGICFLTGGKTDDGKVLKDRNPSLKEIFLIMLSLYALFNWSYPFDPTVIIFKVFPSFKIFWK